MIEADQEFYRLAEGVLSVGLGEENILLSIGSGKYFGVKGAMRHLLEGLREGLTFDEMLVRTCTRYDVTREDAARDLGDMLRKLTGAGIVERVG
jgi:hypothetical protein